MSSSGSMRDIYRAALGGAVRMLGVKRAKCLDSRFRFGRVLNLESPVTLADKLSWIELNTDQTLAARCTDKYAVREYVSKKGLADILVPLCGGPWLSVSEIDIEALPNQFVLKATHGCEMNYICKDKSQLDRVALMEKAALWIESDYARACVEPHYKLIPHRLYAEEFVGGLDDTVDYKFHCFNGEPAFILTCSERETFLRLNLYDLDWRPLSGLQGSMVGNGSVAKPSTLSGMIEAAKKLSADFDFVRVDFYEKEGRIFFGELTFSPACGILPYYTDAFIEEWGSRLRVEGLDY